MKKLIFILTLPILFLTISCKVSKELKLNGVWICNDLSSDEFYSQYALIKLTFSKDKKFTSSVFDEDNYVIENITGRYLLKNNIITLIEDKIIKNENIMYELKLVSNTKLSMKFYDKNKKDLKIEFIYNKSP